MPKNNKKQDNNETIFDMIKEVVSNEFSALLNGEQIAEAAQIVDKLIDTHKLSAQDDLLETLSKITPAAGREFEGLFAQDQSQDYFQNGWRKNLSEVEGEKAADFIDLGPLEATLLEYFRNDFVDKGHMTHNPNIIGTIIDRAKAALNNRVDIKDPVETAPEKTPDQQPVNTPEIEQEITLRWSHETKNGDTINAEDHFSYQSDLSKGRMRLEGEDLDVKGVNDDAIIQLNINKAGKLTAQLKSDWNSVKNIEIEADHEANLTVKNFVHTNIKLGGNEASSITVRGAKRGDIETGDGDDKISIIAKSNGAGWSNLFTIDSHAGADKVYLKGDGGHTMFEIDAGSGADKVKLSGDYHGSVVELGAGNDRFLNGSGADEIYGGAGNDYIRAGAGDDLIHGGAGNDVLYGGNGADHFIWSDDDLGLGQDNVKDFKAKDGDMLDISDILNFDHHGDDLISDFVRFSEATRRKDTTLEVRADGEGDWVALATITRGAQLGNDIQDLVDDGSLII